MDDLPGLIICMVIVAILTTCGLFFIFTDNRQFRDIESQCKQHGYIQDKTTRILCSVEEKNNG